MMKYARSIYAVAVTLTTVAIPAFPQRPGDASLSAVQQTAAAAPVAASRVRLIRLEDNPDRAQAQAMQLLKGVCPRNEVSVRKLGISDGFAGSDPLDFMSPALIAYAQSNSYGSSNSLNYRKAFDDPAADHYVFGSFDIGSCKSCGAVLVVHAKRGYSSLDDNDSIYIGDSTNKWAANRIGEQFWKTYFPTLTEVTFAVQIPASMVNSMIFQGTGSTSYMDFMMQDDSQIDYATLLVGKW